MVICYWHDHYFNDCIFKNNGDTPNASSAIFCNWFEHRTSGPHYFFKKKSLN